jgi:hypothetical protein
MNDYMHQYASIICYCQEDFGSVPKQWEDLVAALHLLLELLGLSPVLLDLITKSVPNFLITPSQHHARRGADEALNDGSAAHHCNNIQPRNWPGAITQREDQEPGCFPLGSFPSGSV